MPESPELESKPVRGFVVMREDKYLGEIGMVSWDRDANEFTPEEYASSLVWTEHADPKEARVIDEEIVYLIPRLINEGRWGKKPTYVIPAEWSERGGVKLLGEKIEFDKLPLREEGSK